MQVGLENLQKPLFYVATVSQPDESVENVTFTLEKSHIQLVLNANGKAELYFHAYFWTRYIDCLKVGLDLDPKLNSFLEGPEINRLQFLAKKPAIVIENFKNQTFGEKEYLEFVEKFGGNKEIKKIQETNKLTKFLFFA